MHRRVMVTVAVLAAGAGGSAWSLAAPWQAETPATLAANEQLSRTDLLELIRAEPDVYGTESATRQIANPAPRFVVGPSGWTPIVQDRAAARTRALRDRAALRAYDGAPPVIPHSRNFAKTKACLDCHTEGFQLGERLGSPMSHPVLANCRQCHVESQSLDLEFADSDAIKNDFVGTIAVLGGTRAGPGAPPVVPHATLMRTNCLSCHGQNGYVGIQTEHAQRLNCVQCHAIAASVDQTSPFFTGTATLLRERLEPEPTLPTEPPEFPEPAESPEFPESPEPVNEGAAP